MSQNVYARKYPLIAALVAVVGAAGYASTRNIWTNPEVRLNKSARADALTSEIDARAKGYSSSVFRDIQKNRDPKATGIF
ncbi:hypothetical protein H632_c815p1 [Helicosporidium sp. ATCC 50920]|nr:hypothetical protein H632_c815p1 [Helicosporidium sp. ATCC 50920]|eukprot:KDD75196.1 hypothetical protein H632_c815p1 [Helicosporidium sp. ATCC 50920]